MPWRDPLLASVQYKSPETVRMLLEEHHAPEGPISDCITPLHIAVTNDDHLCARVLIFHGADVTLVNPDQETPLHLAAYNEASLKTFREVFKAGKEAVYMKDGAEQTPLHIVCLEAHFTKIKALLKLPNPPVNVVDDEGATPMHLLVFIGPEKKVAEVVRVVKIAKRKGFDLNTQTNTGETILHIACQGTYRENYITEMLKLDGIDIAMQDESGNNFLHTFLHCRPGIDLSEEFLFSLFEEATILRKSDLITVLNQKNESGLLPLAFYIMQGVVNVKLVKLLISLTKDVNVQDNFGQTLAHLATQSALLKEEILQILALLFKLGADPNVKDIFGRTPLFFTTKMPVVKLLLENGADVNIADQCKRTPLMTLLRACNPNICQYLLNKGSKVDAQDKFGYSALHYAAWENRIREVEVLIRNEADVHKINKLGQTPRDVASYWRCRHAVKMIESQMEITQKTSKRRIIECDIGKKEENTLWIHFNQHVNHNDIKNIPNMRKQFNLSDSVEDYFRKALVFPGVGLPNVVGEARWIESLVLTVVQSIAKKLKT